MKIITDKNEALIEMRKDLSALYYASKELQNNSEVVLAAVMQDAKALQYASEELQNAIKKFNELTLK